MSSLALNHNIFQNRLFYIVVSVIAPFLLVNSFYFPFSGWTVFGVCLSLYVYLAKANKSKLDIIFFLCCFLTSLNFAFITSSLTVFWSIIVYIYSISYLVNNGPKNNFMKVIHFFCPWIIPAIEVLSTKDNLPSLSKQLGLEASDSNTKITKFFNKFNHYLTNFLITAVLLAIILPLLSYSNQYFGSLISSFLDSIWQVIKSINIGPFTILQLIIFIVSLFLTPKLYIYLQRPISVENENMAEYILNIPKSVVSVTLGLFIFAQVKTYISPELLFNNTGKVANEVFFHLAIVCILIFALLFLNLKRDINAKVLSLILLIQTLALGIFAANSDWSYVTQWGLSHKRLYGFAIISFVVWSIVNLIFHLVGSKVLRQGMVAITAALICSILTITNIANFDSLIAKNPPRENTGVELSYVSDMSLDSNTLKTEYIKQIELDGKYQETCINNSWLENNGNKIKYLQDKYRKVQILGFNWSEYSNYLATQDIIPVIVSKSNITPLVKDKATQILFDNAANNCYRRVYYRDATEF